MSGNYELVSGNPTTSRSAAKVTKPIPCTATGDSTENSRATSPHVAAGSPTPAQSIDGLEHITCGLDVASNASQRSQACVQDGLEHVRAAESSSIISPPSQTDSASGSSAIDAVVCRTQTGPVETADVSRTVCSTHASTLEACARVGTAAASTSACVSSPNSSICVSSVEASSPSLSASTSNSASSHRQREYSPLAVQMTHGVSKLGMHSPTKSKSMVSPVNTTVSTDSVARSLVNISVSNLPQVNVGQRTVASVGNATQQTGMSSLLRAGTSNPTNDDQDDELAEDAASRRGVFGWTTIDEASVPTIYRNDEPHVSVRMVEEKILSKYPNMFPDKVKNGPPLHSYYITDSERKLLNEINTEHCNYEFGHSPFTSRDVVVKLGDFRRFYEEIKNTYTKTVMNHIQFDPKQVVRGGWIQINNTVTPYVYRNKDRFVPLNVMRISAGLKIGVSLSADDSSQQEHEFMNRLCGQSVVPFEFDAPTKMIRLEIVEALCKPVVSELPSSDPFSHAQFIVLDSTKPADVTSQISVGNSSAVHAQQSQRVVAANSSNQSTALHARYRVPDQTNSTTNARIFHSNIRPLSRSLGNNPTVRPRALLQAGSIRQQTPSATNTMIRSRYSNLTAQPPLRSVHMMQQANAARSRQPPDQFFQDIVNRNQDAQVFPTYGRTATSASIPNRQHIAAHGVTSDSLLMKRAEGASVISRDQHCNNPPDIQHKRPGFGARACLPNQRNAIQNNSPVVRGNHPVGHVQRAQAASIYVGGAVSNVQPSNVRAPVANSQHVQNSRSNEQQFVRANLADRNVVLNTANTTINLAHQLRQQDPVNMEQASGANADFLFSNVPITDQSHQRILARAASSGRPVARDSNAGDVHRSLMQRTNHRLNSPQRHLYNQLPAHVVGTSSENSEDVAHHLLQNLCQPSPPSQPNLRKAMPMRLKPAEIDDVVDLTDEGADTGTMGSADLRPPTVRTKKLPDNVKYSLKFMPCFGEVILTIDIDGLGEHCNIDELAKKYFVSLECNELTYALRNVLEVDLVVCSDQLKYDLIDKYDINVTSYMISLELFKKYLPQLKYMFQCTTAVVESINEYTSKRSPLKSVDGDLSPRTFSDSLYGSKRKSVDGQQTDVGKQPRSAAAQNDDGTNIADGEVICLD